MNSTCNETPASELFQASGSVRVAGLGPIHKVARAADAAIEWGIDRLLTWQQRSRDRLALQSLDDRLLNDIGLSRSDIMEETQKPFWRS